VTRTEILTAIQGALADLVDQPELEITEATTAEDVEDWDSITHVRLLITLESEFGVRFETEEIGNLKSVSSLIDLVLKKL
jgi:acyl carrier protein